MIELSHSKQKVLSVLVVCYEKVHKPLSIKARSSGFLLNQYNDDFVQDCMSACIDSGFSVVVDMKR